MRFFEKLKNTAKRICSAMCAVVLTVTSGIITSDMVTMKASAAALHGSTYLSETFSYQESREDWTSFLDAYSKSGNTYYLGTPYSSWLYAASPNGDKWQFDDGYRSNIIGAGGSSTNGGMNCTGFVWFIISHSLAHYSGNSIATTGAWVPNVRNFNSYGFSRNCWSSGGWYTYITQKNVHYYEFSTKSEMLSSGVLQKGDVIWCVNAEAGRGLSGLANTNNYHHIGIYMGNGSSDLWWQSGPINGDGNTTGEINSINQIYGKAEHNTYVVIPWSETEESPTLDPVRINIQKEDSETGNTSAQGAASLAGAEFTMRYYAGTSVSGTPARTWVIRTDSNGRARLDDAHLVSGTLYTDSDGNPAIPLGTVTIQETKAPTGYLINNQVTTLHIVERNGTAQIQVDGSTTYLQEYTATYEEDIIRGDMEAVKIDGNTEDRFTFIPFMLQNRDTGEWHILVTDSQGRIDTSAYRSQANDLDEYKIRVKLTNGEFALAGDDMVSIVGTMGFSTGSSVWFGGGSVNSTEGALPYGNYILREIRCPKNEGYHLITKSFSINASKTSIDLGTLVNTSSPSSILGHKTDTEGAPLEGAVIGIFPEDAKEYTYETLFNGITAVSDANGDFVFKNIPVGEYQIKELAPPSGYLLSEEVYSVTVKAAQSGQTIEMGDTIINDSTQVQFEKTDENGNPIEGATLRVEAVNVPGVNAGTVIDEWVSDGSVHTITGKLAVGGGYTLSEVSAPDGYFRASSSIYFTVNADGSISDSDGNPIDLVSIVNTATAVEIAKRDENGELLPGALLQILDTDGNVIEEWTSGTDTHIITAKLNPGGTYILHEEKAPTGFYKEEDITFTIPSFISSSDPTSGRISVEMTNYATKSFILKTDENGRRIVGAVLQILDESGTVIDQWTTDGTIHKVEKLLNYGETYTLHEVSAPEGYFKAEDISFQVSEKGEIVTPIIMRDVSYGSLRFGKISDIQEQTPGQEIIWLAGAVLQVQDENGNVLEEWTTDNSQHILETVLEPGESYILHEVSAPDGYCTAEDIHFSLDENYNFVKSDAYESGEQWIRMYDLATKVEIQKTDEGGSPLPGAVLQLLDSNGEVVEEWITDTEPYQFYGKLIAGETYTIHEVSAPAGYTVSEDQTFTVGTDGVVQNIDYVNLATKVSIEKNDENGNPVVGAALQLIDQNGTLIEEWITNGEPHELIATLIAGETYILHEVSAPDGYVLADDLRFTVNEDGSMTDVVMEDLTTKVSITKYDITGEHELAGAQLEIRDESGTVLESWTSTEEAHLIESKLIAGQTYVLHEVSAPDGYVVASDVTFTVNPDGTVTEVEMYDDVTKVQIRKTDEDGELLPGALLQIKDKDGNVVEEWTSDDSAHVLNGELTAGETYTLHEVSAPAGYVVSEDQQFTVNADGSITHVEMIDLSTEVYIDKVDPDGNSLEGASLQILNEAEEVLDEWISDGTVHELKGVLTAGETYILRETQSPNGYYVSDDTAFTVNLDGTPNVITLYNVKTKVSITKYDITGENEIAGALMQVKDADGNILEQWTSTEEAHLIEGILNAGETYILHEEIAPDGYVLAEDIAFTVNPDGTVTTVSMKDDTTKVSITKKDITGENEIAGAALEIRDAQGNVIDSWISDGTPHVINGVLVAGATYTLHEVTAPDGYVVAKDVEFTVDASGNVTNVTMLDDTTKVSITKKDITGENEIAGASLEVRDAQGNLIDAWVSDGTPHQIIGVLAVGETYTLHEVSAPDGYVVATDIAFEVNADGSVTHVEMLDDTTKVSITKYEITGQHELPGASLELRDSEGNVIDAWISGTTAHEIVGILTAGETYTLHEVAAPNGYVVANDVTFTVNTDGSVNVVSMYDDTTKVSITKQDITTGAALAGATLQIIDKDGNVLEEWVSTSEAHLIEAVLTAGETYTLREIAAPDGYVLAEDIPFTVNPDGTVTSVVMQDDVTKVSISKYDITGETELAGASMEVRDAQGNVIDAWVSDGTSHQINGVLIAGAEYTLHEVTAPNGYVVASDVTFTVHADGSVTPVSMYDYPTVVHITKKDITTGDELPGAYLELYDKDHNLIDAWVSTNEAHVIEAVLIAGETYTLIETSAPDGYVISEQIEFTVNLDNTITHVEMFDDTTKVQISKKSITGEDELPGASMQLLDKNGNLIDAWISGTQPHFIEGVLIAGETYILHEESAPNGYVVASDITFTVSETGEVDYVEMLDDTTKVEISKTDITGEKPVTGAVLQIIDQNGNVIHEWISGEDVNYLEAQLTAGETYILHEESAPDGYVVSEDITFTVNTDGSVNVVPMYDDTTKVSITKYDITTGEELPGATLQIIDKDGNVVEEWVSTEEAHLIEGILKAGESYTLRELSAPNGWTVAEDVTFTVNTDGSITHVEMYDIPTSVSIRKVDADGKDISGAILQLLDKEGEVIEEWTTDGTAHVLTATLIAGETYTLHEVSAPDGYEVAEDQTFTVDENGHTTEVVMVDEKTPETPNTPTATPTTSTPTPISTSSPKTADAVPLTAFGTGLIASLIIMFLARKKKRKTGKAA